jgi:hypothetical protein
MSTRKRLNRKDSVLRSIVSTIEQHQVKALPAIEGALDPKIRRRLVPDEQPAWDRYTRCFNAIKKALAKNKGALDSLFELDDLVGVVATSQGDVSRAVALAYRQLTAAR